MWRHEYTLTEACGVPMEQALSPDECQRMRMFLRTLQTMQDRYSERGRINVTKFMREWHRGRLNELLKEAQEC